MTDAHRLFIGGNLNPQNSWYSKPACCGTEPDPHTIERAASLLGREVFFVDRKGYQCEMFAAAIQQHQGHIAYVESRAKKKWWTSLVDITIRIHLREANGAEKAIDIQSYNPFFGCDVRFFDWYGDVCVLIYREKHSTYACRFSLSEWPPIFIEIADRWIIKGETLAYLRRKNEFVRRLTVPDLNELEAFAVQDAAELGLVPPDPHTQ